MTKFYLIAVFSIFTTTFIQAQNDNVGVGTFTPDPKAVLDVVTPGFPDQKGMLIPRMSSLLRLGLCDLIGNSCPEGLIVYDTDLQQIWYWDPAAGWKQGSGAQAGDWKGVCIYNSSNHGNVGSPCDHLMISPVTGIRQCLQGWTWVNVSASNQNSGTGDTNHWTGTCIKN